MSSGLGFGTIKSLGVGSGLDIQDIVDKLVAAEGSFKSKKLDSQELSITTKISSYANLKGALSSLRDSLENLKDTSKFKGRTTSIVNDATTSAETTYFTASASNTAVVSSYTLEVESLAQAHKLASATFAGEGVVIGTGTLQIIVGQDQPVSTTYNIAIGENDKTLAGIKSAINNRTSATGVSATILTNDAGSQLIISSNEPGLKNKIGIAVSDDGDENDVDNAGLSQLITANLTEQTAASDGAVRVDGQLITASTNTLTDVIEGVTINLKKAENGKVHTLTIGTDKETSKQKIQSFIDSYNSARQLISEATKFNSSDPELNGSLLGDLTIRNIENSLRNSLVNRVNEPTGITSLADIGITSDSKTGELKLDSAKLDEVLNKNLNAVANLFGEETTGVAVKFYDIVNAFVRDGGTLFNKNEQLNIELQKIADDKYELERKLELLEIDLTRQYSALDTLLGGLQATSSYLASQLNNFVEPLSFKK